MTRQQSTTQFLLDALARFDPSETEDYSAFGKKYREYLTLGDDYPAPADAMESVDEVAPVRVRRQRRPTLASLIKQAERSGREVTSVTLPDGTQLHFGESAPSDESNPWLAHIEKATKQ